MMCALILHEQLPANRSLRFAHKRQDEYLAMIRREMHATRVGRKDPVWDIFEKTFIPRSERGAKRGQAKPGRPQLFRKNGFARKWASENIYVYSPTSQTQWMVTMAAYPGRYSLKEAARLIAGIIANDEL